MERKASAESAAIEPALPTDFPTITSSTHARQAEIMSAIRHVAFAVHHIRDAAAILGPHGRLDDAIMAIEDVMSDALHRIELLHKIVRKEKL